MAMATRPKLNFGDRLALAFALLALALTTRRPRPTPTPAAVMEHGIFGDGGLDSSYDRPHLAPPPPPP
jgi:hypothetical protein